MNKLSLFTRICMLQGQMILWSISNVFPVKQLCRIYYYTETLIMFQRKIITLLSGVLKYPVTANGEPQYFTIHFTGNTKEPFRIQLLLSGFVDVTRGVARINGIKHELPYINTFHVQAFPVINLLKSYTIYQALCYLHKCYKCICANIIWICKYIINSYYYMTRRLTFLLKIQEKYQTE